MKFYIIPKAISLLCVLFTTSTCYTGVERDPILQVEFDLPPGWEEFHNDPGYVSIGKGAAEDSDVTKFKLETIPLRVFKGSSNDAYEFIKHYYDHRVRPGTQIDVNVIEISLPSGMTVFADVRPVASAHGNGYDTIWAFESMGYVIPMYLNDDIHNHMQVVDIVASSASVSLR